jgi:large subunit ribosomal protein L10
MAITKQKKQSVLAKLADAAKEAKAIAFVGFSKLTVKDVSAVRKELAKEGVSYYVAKKSLIRKALTDHGYQGEMPELPGEIAIAWTAGEDTTAPARTIHEHGKKLKGALALLGGIFEGAFKSYADITALATIPPVAVLRGMFANIINSPRGRFATVLGEVAKTKN